VNEHGRLAVIQTFGTGVELLIAIVMTVSVGSRQIPSAFRCLSA
jgi:hypothetical protein